MGNTRSMCKDIFKKNKNNVNGYCGRSSSMQSPNDGQLLPSEEHDQELEILRQIIERNPELFILNNLMLSIQFFENYEEDIMSSKQTLSSTCDIKFNTYLPPHKHVIMPDVLEEQVSQNVNFTYIQPTLMIPSIEPLQPIRIYVVYDNIEVTEQNFSSPYSNVNGIITYNMQLKQSKHKGYALLQRLEVNPSQNYIEQHHLVSGDKKKSMTVSTVYNESNDDAENNDSGGGSLHTDNKMSHNKNNNDINNKNNKSILNRKIDMIESDRCENRNLKTTSLNLHHANNNNNNNNIYGNNDECKNGTTSILHGRLNNKDINSSRTSPAESTSSGYRSGNYTIDSDSDDLNYNLTRTSTATVINSRNSEFKTSNMKKHFHEKERLTDNEISSELPRQCFEIYNPQRNRKQKLNRKDKMLQDFIYYDHQCDVWYLSSQKFMDYFYKLFINKLSILMGFDVNTTRITVPSATGYSESINNVAFDRSYGPIIYCDKFELLQTISSSLSSSLPSSLSPIPLQLQQKYQPKQGMKNNKFAIIPCIWSPWPEIADEWIERPRIWPHYSIIEKIKEIGCHLIPKSYIDDKDYSNNHNSNNISANNNSLLKNLEWEVTFPEAERYLETCMTHSQLRIYLMALVLHKTFIQSATIVDSYPGLTSNHIRNQLFWLIEENDKPGKWLDNHMGEALMRLLNSLYRCISQDVPCMRDYFIRDKNIFQGKIYLLRTQKQLKRIMENPIMYLLHAMQNIEYRQNFFPKLDYDILIKILTEDNFTLMHPHISVTNMPNKIYYHHDQHPIDGMDMSNDDFYLTDKNHNQRNGDGGFWNSAKQINQPNKQTRKPQTNKALIDTRISYDQVLEISVRCAELQEPGRLCLLLDLFIKHFIKIAEFCHKYGALTQKSVYIDQALRLSILLSEYSTKGLTGAESNHHIKENVKLYKDKLNALKSRANLPNNVKKRSDNFEINSPMSPPPLPPPLLPTRNATATDSPIFSTSLRDRYTNVNYKSNQDEVSDNCYNGVENNENNNNQNNNNSNKHITTAVIHADSSTKIKNAASKVVLLAEDDEESSLSTETTYI